MQLTNYGTTRDQYHDMDRSSETRVLKTFDYLAPEYEETVIHSSKTDVYSFGLVLLQLITGWKTLADTHGKSLLAWVIFDNFILYKSSLSPTQNLTCVFSLLC